MYENTFIIVFYQTGQNWFITTAGIKNLVFCGTMTKNGKPMFSWWLLKVVQDILFSKCECVILIEEKILRT